MVTFVILCLWLMLKMSIYPQQRTVTRVTPDWNLPLHVVPEPCCICERQLKRWSLGCPAFQPLPVSYLMALGNPSHTKYINIGGVCVVLQTSGCFKCRCCWKLRSLVAPLAFICPCSSLRYWFSPALVGYLHPWPALLAAKDIAMWSRKIGISQFSGYCVSFNRQGNISC